MIWPSGVMMLVMAENVASPPEYIRFDKRQREDFLSQFGITAPVQRDLFHQICAGWQPLIDFDTFVGARLGQFDHVENELVSLLSKLKSAKLGLVTTRKGEGGERRNDKIVFCDEGDRRFWFFFVQELLTQACDNPRNPFLTFSLLKSREILIPTDHFLDLAPEQVSKSGFDELAKSEVLFAVTLQDEKVLATSQALNILMTFSIAKLRVLLKNPDVLSQVSRSLNVGLTDLAKRVDEKDLGFWKVLTENLVANNQDLLADRKLHLDRSFFQAAELFRIYCENQLVEIRRQKEKAQEREADLLLVEQVVAKDKLVLMAPSEFESRVKLLLAEKYGQGFLAFQEEFRNDFMAPGTRKTGLPPVLVLKAGLIHRNNVYLQFVRRFEALQNLAWQDFAKRMERLVRTSNRGNDLAFVNLANLEHALNEWTSANDSFVSELFHSPKLLAEALIHYGKTTLNLGSVEEMKLLMEQFFRPGVMTLRPLQEIYGVDPRQLFESAFKQLNVFTQFWRRLTGKYQVLAEEFAALGLGKVKPLSIRAAMGSAVSARRDTDDDVRDLDQLSPAERQLRKKEWQIRKRSTASSPSEAPVKVSHHKPTPAPVVKHYSDQEKDNAWTSFRDSLKG